MIPDARRGILLATLAYVAWGFLSPVGQLLLEYMGPFTLNAWRTLLAIPLLLATAGPRASRDAVRAVTTTGAPWILGAVWLVVTFGPYHASLAFLPPTIATLTIYLAPLIVAAWQHVRFHEPVSRLLIPTVLVTLVGAWMATRGPGGVPYDLTGALGIGLALLGVAGWAGYTIHLKALTRTRDANTLTLGAFLTSGAAFFVLALAFEGLQTEWTQRAAMLLALYTLLPTFLSFWLYSLSLRLANAATVTVLLGVELIATAFVSAAMTDELFTPLKIAGLAVVAAAITLYLMDERRTARRASRSSV